MAKKNVQLAVFVLIAIFILSLFLYPHYSVTGNYAQPTPELCAKYLYPVECGMVGCSWSSEKGCVSPAIEDKTLVIPSPNYEPCNTDSWWKCVTSKGCHWANRQCRERRL